MEILLILLVVAIAGAAIYLLGKSGKGGKDRRLIDRLEDAARLERERLDAAMPPKTKEDGLDIRDRR